MTKQDSEAEALQKAAKELIEKGLPQEELPPLPAYFQNIFVTLSDGRTGMFSGAALTTPEETTATIQDVKIGKPIKMTEWEAHLRGMQAKIKSDERKIIVPG